MSKLNKAIEQYNAALDSADAEICNKLLSVINEALDDAESKIWHAHPVWFLDGNPIVGYSKQKAGIRLMFWSGAGFEEEGLKIKGDKFKDASVFYNKLTDIKVKDLKRWLEKSKIIQWDYKNLVKRKGQLLKIEVE